jgi:outer membrane immunogenic protein
MKRLFLACGVLVALAGAAAAADLPPRAAPSYYKAPAYVPAYTWSGFYIGVNGGGAFGSSAWDSAGSFNTTGGLVGGTLGYNYQIGQAVLGVEGDLDWAKIQGSNAVAQTSDTWLSTVRGRLGYAADRFLPFVTAGGAFGDIRATPAAPGLSGGSQTNAGWTVGGGLEFAVAGNFTLKAEYLYVDLGKFNCGGGCLAGAATDNVSFTTNIVRAGLNYRF